MSQVPSTAWPPSDPNPPAAPNPPPAAPSTTIPNSATPAATAAYANLGPDADPTPVIAAASAAAHEIPTLVSEVKTIIAPSGGLTFGNAKELAHHLIPIVGVFLVFLTAVSKFVHARWNVDVIGFNDSILWVGGVMATGSKFIDGLSFALTNFGITSAQPTAITAPPVVVVAAPVGTPTTLT